MTTSVIYTLRDVTESMRAAVVYDDLTDDNVYATVRATGAVVNIIIFIIIRRRYATRYFDLNKYNINFV